MTADLAQLAHDIDTATAHLSPTWADHLSVTDLQRVLSLAERMAADERAIRNNMRKPN